jgi:pimeloyl-ACP methyl ester carboxylesterase
MLGSLVKIALGVAIAVPALLWLFQERMIFFPQALQTRPVSRGGFEEIVIAAADGAKLRGWFVRGSGPAALVIYFGGNAEEVSWLTDFSGRFGGGSLLLVNYRGYGESEGAPGERALLDDAVAVYEYAVRRADVDPERIVAMGRSLGSGVAVHLAAERRVRAVILVSPYDSLVSVAKRHYPFLPVSLMLRHRFDSLARARRIEVPLLCLVATEDRVIPISHSRALFDAWRGPKTWREIPRSDHDTISGDPGYWTAIAGFLGSQR